MPRLLRTLLPLLLLVAASAPAQDVSRTRPFVSGTSGYHTFRIPALLTAQDGSVLAFAEGRVNGGGDAGDIDLVLRRSADGGRTWLPLQVVQQEGIETIGNPAPVLDRDTGRVWLLFCRNNDRVFETHSDDHGVTWSARRELTSTVKRADWGWYATGPVHGIQLRRGPRAGRLVIPCDHNTTTNFAHVVYSDDHGANWYIGGSVAGVGGMRPNECAVVELTDGRLALNIRDQNGGGDRRIVAYSSDGGGSFGTPFHDDELIDPRVQGSILRLEATDQGDGRDWILFSNPASTTDRVQMTIRSSFDETRSWPVARTLWTGPSAYSDLAVAGDGGVLCLFEGGISARYEYIECARFDRDWLSGGVPQGNPIYDGFESTASRSSLGGSATGTGFAGAWRETPGARLAGHWRLGGDVLDSSGSGHHGTLVGGVFVPDLPTVLGTGTSLRLFGGAYVDLSAHVGAFATQSGGTLAAFFKTTGAGTHVLVAASDSSDPGDEIRLFVEGGRLLFDVRGIGPDGGQLVSPQTVNDGNWHHAAVTVDALGFARLYLDGQQVAAEAEPWFDGVSGLDRMAIGRNVDSGGPQWFFSGEIAEVVAVHQALDAADVQALAAGTPPASLTGQADPAGVGTAVGSLDLPAFRQLGLRPVGDRVRELGGAVAARRLAATVDSRSVGTFHLAALVRRTSTAASFSIALEDPGAGLVAFGMARDGRYGVGTEHPFAGGPVPVAVDAVQHLVCRVTLRGNGLLDARLKVYGPSDALDADPSGLSGVGGGAGQWTAEALGLQADAGSVGYLVLRTSEGAAVEFDEIRVGGTWSDVVQSASSRRRVGIGCPANPVPSDLWSLGLPFPGNSVFAARLLGAPGSATCTLLAGFSLAPQPIPLPIGAGCFVYPQPPLLDVGTGTSTPSGYLDFPLPIPAQPGLIGFELPLQTVAVDPIGSGVALSNGLLLKF